MVEFEHSSNAWNREMEEFEPSSDAWNRKWRSLSKVPMVGIGNGGVQAKFGRLESAMEKIEPSLKLGIGNGGVRAQFQRLE